MRPGLAELGVSNRFRYPTRDTATAFVEHPKLNPNDRATPRGSRRKASIAFGPSGREVVLAGAALGVCVYLVGTSWGFTIGALLFVALLGVYAVTAADRYRVTDDVVARLVATNRELEHELEERVRSEDRLRDRVRVLEGERSELGEQMLLTETADRSKSEFLANISQEIRTPMNGVLGAVELLLESELREEQRDYARTIEASTTELLKILHDVFELSKLEAGRLELEESDFDLPRCVHSVVEHAFAVAHDKGLELLCYVDPNVPRMINGDSNRLRQVLSNLVENAVKFTEKGEIRVEARASLRDDSGADTRIEFLVSDTGIGIPSHRLEKLFHPHVPHRRRVDGESPRPGLGLVICRRLLEMMDGDIDLDSEEGRGTRVTFTLPFAESEIEQVRSDELENLRGCRVLVVDPNASSRRLLSAHAEALGLVPQEAAGEPDALRAIEASLGKSTPPDFVLIDSVVEGGGLELAEKILRITAASAPKLISLRTSAETFSSRDLVRAGFDAWVNKPLSRDKLRATFEHVAVDVDDGGVATPVVTSHDKSDLGKTPSVLLVEDNVVNQKIGSLLLKKLGCEVELASDGQQAVDIVRNREFDLVFMDCQMPIMTGFEATREIRSSKEERLQRLPIIAMTAQAMPGDRERCLKVGMNDYLPKPVRKEDIGRMIQKWVRASQKVSRAPVTTLESTMEILDQTVIEALRELGGDDDPELFAELVGLFLSDTPERIKELHRAFDADEPDAIERAAHALKSSAANLGALQLSELFKQIEAAGRASDMQVAGELVGRTDESYQQVEAALKAELN